MKIEIDKEADAAYIYFKDISEGEVDKTVNLNKNLNIDFSKNNELIGIEILDYNKS